jgi:hypothetical protein
MLDGDPAPRGMTMLSSSQGNDNVALSYPFWLTAEASEWEGLRDKGFFKKWKRSDRLKKTIVFLRADTFTKLRGQPKLELLIALRHVLLYEVSRWRKERTLQNFSLTPGIAIAGIIASIGAANDLELHSIDIEQAFLQADKLMEAVNGRYFINVPPIQMLTTRILCMKCCDLYTEIPRHHEPYIKPCLFQERRV